jgi:hypothetical protein
LRLRLAHRPAIAARKLVDTIVPVDRCAQGEWLRALEWLKDKEWMQAPSDRAYEVPA